MELWVPDRPLPWERTTPVRGAGKVLGVMKRNQRNHQEAIRQEFLDYLRMYPEDLDLFPWKEACRICVHSFYPIAQKDILKDGFRWEDKTDSPDCSNLLKQPEDAFNKKATDSWKVGTFPPGLRPWLDDSHAAQVYSTKHKHPYVSGQLIAIELWTNPTTLVPWDRLDNTFGEARNLFSTKKRGRK